MSLVRLLYPQQATFKPHVCFPPDCFRFTPSFGRGKHPRRMSHIRRCLTRYPRKQTSARTTGCTRICLHPCSRAAYALPLYAIIEAPCSKPKYPSHRRNRRRSLSLASRQFVPLRNRPNRQRKSRHRQCMRPIRSPRQFRVHRARSAVSSPTRSGQPVTALYGAPRSLERLFKPRRAHRIN
jgi:hypothetical protein